jgi:hypothetical protein
MLFSFFISRPESPGHLRFGPPAWLSHALSSLSSIGYFILWRKNCQGFGRRRNSFLRMEIKLRLGIKKQAVSGNAHLPGLRREPAGKGREG